MSYTKYVMTAEGKFVMISKYSGLQHLELSLLLPEEPTSAGFVTIMDGQLTVYGQSISLGMRSKAEDSKIIQDALEGGSMALRWDDLCDQFIAGNIDHIKMLPDEVSLETLVSRKIIEPL